MRHRFTWLVAGSLALGTLVGGLVWLWLRPEPIRVGILHSRTGPMAASEQAVIDATIMALEEINAAGGAGGRPVQWVIADGASSETTFAEQADRLIQRDRVAALFGCWTSASRKAVREVVERHDHLLFYPVQYEGCETSPNIVYLGAAPNQQIVPAVAWGLERVGRRVALIGSDYVFPRMANAIMRDQIHALQGELVAEVYVPLSANAAQLATAVEAIKAAHPDLIMNTINGEANVWFFEGLAAATTTVPTVISFSLAEPEIAAIDTRSRPVGQLAAWNYFQSVSRPENRAFVAAFRKRFGADRVVSDPMEAAYCGVKLWAQAVSEAGTEDTTAVRAALAQQSMNAPEGVVSIDPENQHTWKTVRIGRVQNDGQFEIVWDSGRPVPPLPFPITRPRSEWEGLLASYFREWGGRWSNPATEVVIIPPSRPIEPPTTPVADPVAIEVPLPEAAPPEIPRPNSFNLPVVPAPELPEGVFADDGPGVTP